MTLGEALSFHSLEIAYALGLFLALGMLITLEAVVLSPCPAETLVSNFTNAKLIRNTLFALCVGAALVVGYRIIVQHPFPFGGRVGTHLIPAVSAILLLAGWPLGAFAFYCATPHAILIHPAPFAAAETHLWLDVVLLRVGCTIGRYSATIFDLHLKDGHWISLGGRAWPEAERHYPEIVGALSTATFGFDNLAVKECGRELQQRFAQLPG